ncbi:uncharacterized protein LOC127873928 [Dreissena polymorpha]|nr:uncharacterized protein LOC127873928 [Dreissena polymorpha]
MEQSSCFVRTASTPAGNFTNSGTFASKMLLTYAQTGLTVACDRSVLSPTVSWRSPLATYLRFPGRRFYINRPFNNCPDDRTYIAVLTDKPERKCQYDQRESYPQFIYSKLNGSGNPMLTEEFSTADKFVIRARYSIDAIDTI